MLDNGMNVARLNFSHGDHASHGKMLETLRESMKLRPDKVCAVLLDTKGPEIRTGFLQDHKSITLTKD
jgi:pyruvate kinase